MCFEALGEPLGMDPDVVDDDGDDSPSDFLQAPEPRLVSAHCHGAGMPQNALVFRGDALSRPREIDPVGLAVPAEYFVLQFRKRQAEVDHHETRLTFHPGFRTPVGVREELADYDDAAPPVLCSHRGCKLGAGALQ